MSGLTRGVQSVKVDGVGDAAILLRVASPLEPILMKFQVSMSVHDGRTSATSEILQYKTSRQSVMFVPVTPSTMIGYEGYKAFGRRLVDLVRAADPSANSTSTMW